MSLLARLEPRSERLNAKTREVMEEAREMTKACAARFDSADVP